VRLIAAAVASGAAPGQGTPVVVFNPLGFARGGVAQLPARAVTGSVAAVSAGSATGPVQRAADGGLLFQIPGQVGSFGYTTVTLQPGNPPSVPLPAPSDTVTLGNGLVAVTLDRTKGWAITSFAVGGTQLLPPAALGNSIRLYNDTGNLYQFGNEPLEPPIPPSKRGVPGTFTDSGTSLAGDAGKWIEAGPVRWHFQATVTGTYGTSPDGQPRSWSCTLDYLLHAGETVLRMRLTGAAPPATSVLTAFDLAPPSGSAGYGLTYGTAHHYDDHQPTPYWTGPTFRATHDFAQTTGSAGPQLAIYHQGVPAWCTVGSGSNWQLLGALLRNTDGQDRGAAGTDPDVHTLEYALGLADASPVATGDALRTAMAVTNPLVAAVARTKQAAESVSLPTQASLAAITQPSTGILRVARTQPGSTPVVIPQTSGDSYYAERRSLSLRVYLPAPSQSGVIITLPSLPNPNPPITGYSPDLAAVAVSALDEPLTDAQAVTVSPGTIPTISFAPDLALTTVQLTVTRCPTLPDNGKS
jgi:alpha-mannosidase